MDEDWEVVVSFLPSGWEELGRETGALKGLRKDKSAEALLRVLLLHLARGHSLRETVVRAREAKLADLSDVALLKRLRKSSEWLRELCAAVFREQGAVAAAGGERFRAFDATTVKEPGRTGSLWRLHYSVRLPSLACDFFKLTATEGAGVAETLSHFPIAAGDLVLADRGYSTAAGLDHVASSGGHATVRVNTGSLPLQSPDGTPLNLLERVAELRRPCVAGAWPATAVGRGVAVPGRVCAIRKTGEAARIAQRKARDRAARQGRRVRPSTLEFARHVILFTTFPEADFDAGRVLDWYRVRWQVELVFKRFKSLAQLGHLPKREDDSARAWLHGKLLVALLAEKLVRHAGAVSPWGGAVADPPAQSLA